MPAIYQIWVTDPLGTTLDVIDDWLSLTYTRVINDIGSLTLVVDGDYNLFTFFKLDGRIAVYRNSKLDTETVWLIREIIRTLDGQGRRTITVKAVSANEILSRRVIAYAAGTVSGETGYAAASGAADNVMKDIIRQNFSSSASSFRDISSYLDIEANATLGPTVYKEYPDDNVLDVLKEISQATITAGSSVYFDIVSPTQSTLEFRTYKDLRGIDHSFPGGLNPVILSPDRGNLVDVVRTYDWSDEATYVYARGQESSATASSNDRIGESPFNLREIFVNVSGTAGSNAAQDEANAALRAGRPRRSFRGELVNVPRATEYGNHWRWGDKVTAQFEGESIDCTIDAVQVSVVKGKETINGNLRAVES